MRLGLTSSNNKCTRNLYSVFMEVQCMHVNTLLIQHSRRKEDNYESASSNNQCIQDVQTTQLYIDQSDSIEAENSLYNYFLTLVLMVYCLTISLKCNIRFIYLILTLARRLYQDGRINMKSSCIIFLVASPKVGKE